MQAKVRECGLGLLCRTNVGPVSDAAEAANAARGAI